MEKFLHVVFGLPYAWIQFPDIIFYWLIPQGLLIGIFYVLLNKAMHVLSQPANASLAIIIGLLCSRIAVMSVQAGGLVGGIITLSAVLTGLCAITYGFGATTIFGILGAGLVLGWFIGLVTVAAIASVAGFFIVIAFIGRVLGITETRTVLVIIGISILIIILPSIITAIRTMLKI